jgi:hypothetical protein
LFCSV